MPSGSFSVPWAMADTRKLEHAALVVPIFGAVLIVPPVINIFLYPIHFAGAPLIVAYLFAVWVGLIMATALMSRHMKDHTPPEPRNTVPAAVPDEDAT